MTPLDLTPQECADLVTALTKQEAWALQKLLQLEPLETLTIGEETFPVVALPREYRGAYVIAVRAKSNPKTGHPFEEYAHDEALIVRVFLEASGWKGDFETLRAHVDPLHIMMLKIEYWRQLYTAAMSNQENWPGRA